MQFMVGDTPYRVWFNHTLLPRQQTPPRKTPRKTTRGDPPKAITLAFVAQGPPDAIRVTIGRAACHPKDPYRKTAARAVSLNRALIALGMARAARQTFFRIYRTSKGGRP